MNWIEPWASGAKPLQFVNNLYSDLYPPYVLRTVLYCKCTCTHAGCVCLMVPEDKHQSLRCFAASLRSVLDQQPYRTCGTGTCTVRYHDLRTGASGSRPAIQRNCLFEWKGNGYCHSWVTLPHTTRGSTQSRLEERLLFNFTTGFMDPLITESGLIFECSWRHCTLAIAKGVIDTSL